MNCVKNKFVFKKHNHDTIIMSKLTCKWFKPTGDQRYILGAMEGEEDASKVSSKFGLSPLE